MQIRRRPHLFAGACTCFRRRKVASLHHLSHRDADSAERYVRCDKWHQRSELISGNGNRNQIDCAATRWLVKVRARVRYLVVNLDVRERQSRRKSTTGAGTITVHCKASRGVPPFTRTLLRKVTRGVTNRFCKCVVLVDCTAELGDAKRHEDEWNHYEGEFDCCYPLLFAPKNHDEFLTEPVQEQGGRYCRGRRPPLMLRKDWTTR
ncbi:hypothetical protein SAMN05421829_1017 [Aromatoleum tolulyticum]|uniref:Uncharacterized protein n=1 Tax=Aromatoleum tolulyticum TaxID=34027 RepID=A0A1N6N2S8_9RHOO|nr:hypothetical protein SAMN05421829_1017 [Aromatoleum tolulyticum]